MSPRDGSRRRVLTQDERVLWTMVTQSIEPLRASPLPLAEVDAQSAPGEGTSPNENHLPAHPDPLPQGKREHAALAANASNQKTRPQPLAALDRRTKQRVARGREAIDARLDLHGLTQAQAHSTLLRFLRDASARGARLVLVITGKGAKNMSAHGDGSGERGVLRRQVPQWLALPEFRGHVIGFADAHVAHGGEGALYVRLRKPRD